MLIQLQEPSNGDETLLNPVWAGQARQGRGGEPRSSSPGLKVDVDFTLPFGSRWRRWVAVSRGEVEGAAAISSCTHVPFPSVLRSERKQQEVGSGGNQKGKSQTPCRRTC